MKRTEWLIICTALLLMVLFTAISIPKHHAGHDHPREGHAVHS